MRLQPASEARLEVTWDGVPVEFGDTVAYVCQQGLFLEAGRHIAEVRVTRDTLHMTRDIVQVNVTCDGAGTGAWLSPRVWPRCVDTVHCGPPPEKHRQGEGLLRVGTLPSLS